MQIQNDSNPFVQQTNQDNIKFKILEHPADLKIQAFGKTKEELFLNILYAMAKCQKGEIKDKTETKREIKVESPDLPALLVDFLSEVLYLSQANNEVYFKANFTEFSDTYLEGELIGQKVERFGEDIKAVTYHSLEVKKVNDHWEAVVLFDI